MINPFEPYGQARPAPIVILESDGFQEKGLAVPDSIDDWPCGYIATLLHDKEIKVIGGYEYKSTFMSK